MFRAALISLLATIIIALFAFEIVASPFAPVARYAYLVSLGAFFYTFIVGLVERFVPMEPERPETALSEDGQTLVEAMQSAEIALRLASVEFAVVENADQATSVIRRSDPDFLYVDDVLEGALAARRSKNRARVLILLSDERLRGQPDPVIAGALSHFGVGNEVYASEGAAR